MTSGRQPRVFYQTVKGGRLSTNTLIFITGIIYLEQPGVPEGLSRQREKLLHSSGLLPHHELLSRRGEVQGGDNVRVVRQLGPDGLTVQLLHTVHDQFPLTLRLGLFHWRCERGKGIKLCWSFSIITKGTVSARMQWLSNLINVSAMLLIYFLHYLLQLNKTSDIWSW